ncbi:DUF1573 domain-containing protein [Rufibacter sp. LB8]|uniref:DUF1573 domain-containing protein n=1 Tax=Rufibacter sp. LB8 TaxID=2777781 RepID=UPI00178C35F2|nr:DUF1573 domain-containing protein [Rufibacter sp. LB8]
MKKIYLLLAFVLVVLAQGSAMAQGVLKFEKDVHDFGTLTQGVPATYNFKFTNTGSAPVTITHVQPACGCTTPEWPKEAIQPGQSGVIKAGYNSASAGAFNKAMTVRISNNGQDEEQMLFIKGTVVDKAAAPAPSAGEVASSAKITLTSSSFDFGKVEKGQKVTAKFNLKNTGKSDLNVSGVQAACNCVAYKMSPAVVKPGQSAKLELTYTPQVLQNKVETVTLLSNDVSGSSATLTLKANVVESLAKQSDVKVSKASVPFK